MTQSFLVCYDYGRGGVWGYVRAASASEITEKFPELVVADEVPAWMSDDIQAKLKEREEDIERPSDGLLATLLRDRQD